MSSYGYTIFLKDLVSSKMMKVASTSNTVYGKINKLQDKHRNKVFKSAKSIDGLNNRLNKLKRQRGAATSVKEMRNLNKESRKVTRTLEKLEKMPPLSFLERIKKAKKEMGSMAKTAIVSVGVFGAFRGLKGLYNLGADAESSRLKFETLLGSVDKANNMIAKINQFANATPFNNKDLKQNAELLLSFGTAQSKVLPTLKMIGDISGGNKEKLNSLTLAYAQMSSTGKLMGQDLLQMINAGFNPLQIISEKTGKSMSVLKKEMSQGRISTAMVEAAFQSATAKGGRFHGMLEKMSKSSSGLASTLVGGFQTKLADFSEKYFLPLVNKALQFGLQLMEGFESFVPPIINFFKALQPITHGLSVFISGLFGLSSAGSTAGGVISFITGLLNTLTFVVEIISNGVGTLLIILEPLAPVLKIIAFAVIGFKIAVWALNTVMWANPVMLIVRGIILLIGVVVTAFKKVGWFRGAIMGAWEAIKGFGKIIKDFVIDRIKGLISGVVGIGKTLMYFFTGEWSKAWETGKKAVKDLVGIDAAKTAVKNAKQTGKNIAKAYVEGVNDVNKSKSKKAVVNLNGQTTKPAGVNINPQAGLNGDPKMQQGIENITGGGSKQTNINVSFEKLVENIILKSETLKEGVDQIQEEVSRALVGAVNSINQMQTS